MDELLIKGLCTGLAIGSVVLSTSHIRQIRDPVLKQWASTTVGVFSVLVGCGLWSFCQFFFMATINGLIMTRQDKRHCFIVCFCLSFAHLGFYFIEPHLNLNLPPTDPNSNLAAIAITLKMSHLAGEIQDVHLVKMAAGNRCEQERLKVYKDMTLSEIYHYCFCHLSNTSFFRYRTYYDWLHHPLHAYIDYKAQALKKVSLVIKNVILVFSAMILIPLGDITKPEFYVTHSFVYVFAYCTVTGIMVSSIMFSMMVVSDALCIWSGLGVYPSVTQPAHGHGPTTQLEVLEEIYKDPSKAAQYTYNFHTIRNIYIRKALFPVSFRKFWKSYNLCVNYFLVTNVYKRFPIKRLRMLAVLLVAAYFHGWFVFRYINMIAYLLLFATEDLWYRILGRKNATGIYADFLDHIFWLSQILLHLHTANLNLFIMYFEPCYLNLRGIMFFPYTFLCPMYLIGLCLGAFAASKESRADRKEK